MEFDTWLLYSLAVLVLTASPGPSVLLCLTKSVTEGFQSSIYTALGSLTAIVGIMTLSFTGLGLLIASSEFVFNIIKWLGAGYLIYLGIKAFTSTTENYEVSNSKNKKKKSSVFSLFRSGFFVGVSNPKAIVFFTALFPQFIVSNQPLLSQYLIFTATFAVLELSWLLLYSYFGARSSNWLMEKSRAKIFNKVTGGIFVGAGLILSSTKSTT